VLGSFPARDRHNPASPAPLRQPVRIAVVDDDEHVHFAVRQAIETTENRWLVESYLNASEALDHIPSTRPHAVLMDISIRHICGITCTWQLKQSLPLLPIVILTGNRTTPGFLRSFMAGACGYLVKPAAAHDIVDALTKAIRGQFILCPTAQTVLLQWLRAAGDLASSNLLSSREQQILACVFEDLSNKEIAESLGIGCGTVHTHLARLFRKLGVHSRDEALWKFLATVDA
jgi:two-component system, NarL family, response regulator LiaR